MHLTYYDTKNKARIVPLTDAVEVRAESRQQYFDSWFVRVRYRVGNDYTLNCESKAEAKSLERKIWAAVWGNTHITST